VPATKIRLSISPLNKIKRRNLNPTSNTRGRAPRLTAGITAADDAKVVDRVSKGKWKAHFKAKGWVGIPIAEALGLDLRVLTDEAKVKAVLKMYLKAGTLVQVERMDEDQRKLKMFIEVADPT
jgi:hypothetical protein